MNDRTNRTVICSVAFLDIVDYSKRVGQEQLVLKQRFNALIGEVVKDIAPNDRVLIDTGDGAALCFMGDPEDALFVSMNLRDRLRTPACEAIGLTVRIGINLGPVRMITDINDHQNVIGDGINVAQRVMSFAEPNQIMVSRTYFEVVSRLSQEFTKLFSYAGARTDKHVREHEIYEVGPGHEEAAAMAAAEVVSAARSSAATTEARTASLRAPMPEAAPITRIKPPRPANSGATSTNGGVTTTMGAFAGTVATDAAGTDSGGKAGRQPAAPNKTPPPKRGKPMAALAAGAVVAVAVVAFAALHFKSDNTPVAAQSETASGGAAVTAQKTPEPAGTKTDGAAPASAANGNAAAGSPPSLAKADATASATTKSDSAAHAGTAKPGAAIMPAGKADAVPAHGAKPGAAGKADAQSKATAAKGAAPQPAVVAPPPPAPDKSAKTKLAQKADAKKADARKDTAGKASAVAMGKVELWISPFGDVFIDGKALGSSPPLKVYELAAGSHRIEIYNDSAGFPHKETIDVKAGEVTRVNKTFR